MTDQIQHALFPNTKIQNIWLLRVVRGILAEHTINDSHKNATARGSIQKHFTKQSSLKALLFQLLKSFRTWLELAQFSKIVFIHCVDIFQNNPVKAGS